MSIPGLPTLILALHEGLHEQPMWDRFLVQLKAMTGAQFSGLLLRFQQDEPRELAQGLPPAARLSPLLLAHDLREGRVYAAEEIIEAERMATVGIRDLRVVRVAEPGRLEGWLVIGGSRRFSAADGRLLDALAPHLRSALRTLAVLEAERMRSTVHAAAFGRLNFGWITLDAQCRIIDADDQAQWLLHRTRHLRRGRYDRLVPTLPALDRELTALVKNFATQPEAKARALCLSRDPWIDMLVTPARAVAASSGTRAAAIVYLSGDRSSNEDRRDQLVELFQLTPGEARLTWGIAQGLSIAEAAQEAGLTVETARNYSKKIYAKTGARGQSDLVRHILTSVLALA